MASASSSKSSGVNYGYDYLKESDINPFLKCPVCQRALVDPVAAPDDRRCCRKCLRELLSPNLKDFDERSAVAITEPIIMIMLNSIPVRCRSCYMENIARGEFNDHILHHCSKAPVSCRAKDIKCNWFGPREELNEHLAECRFEPLRPVFQELFEEQNELKHRLEILTKQIQSLAENQQGFNNH